MKYKLLNRKEHLWGSWLPWMLSQERIWASRHGVFAGDMDKKKQPISCLTLERVERPCQKFTP
jgi:hypothetical protein